jgi:hypothetical protein
MYEKKTKQVSFDENPIVSSAQGSVRKTGGSNWHSSFHGLGWKSLSSNFR